jgi:heat shock protein HslJ
MLASGSGGASAQEFVGSYVNTPYSLTLNADRSWSGSAGCNNLFGRWEQSGGQVRFTSVAGTKKLCPPPIMAYENAFTRALRDGRGQLAGKVLELTSPGDPTIRLTRQAAQGPKLEFERVYGVRQLDGAPQPRPDNIGLRFTADGRFSGSSGCNQLFGSYTLRGPRLTLLQAGTTLKACPPAVTAAERAFQAAIRGSATLAGDRIVFRRNGRVMMVLG